MVLSLLVLCTLFEFGMSLSDEWWFLYKICHFLYKGPIRACRRVRVYSPHWSRLMGILPSSFFLLYYVTAAIFQLYNKLNSTCTYSFIGSLSSNGPTFSKYSNMLICSTCRFRQLATNMSCSVMREISLSSMLMLTAEVAWQQMHSSAVSIVEHDPHSHLKWLEQLLNKLMQITSSGMSWKKALHTLKRLDLIFGVLMPLSKIFQLYHGDQF
jgi:hypothetical protein